MSRVNGGAKKLLVVCPFPEGVAAGQRLKYEQYLDEWRSAGYCVDVRSFMSTRLWKIAYKPGRLVEKALWTLLGQAKRLWLLWRLSDYDIVYVFMSVTPIGSSFFERVYRFFSRRLILDLEDNLMLQAGNDVNPITQFLRGKDKFSYLIKASDHVVASSTFLARDCAAMNKRGESTYISSSLDIKRYVAATDFSNERPITIGWTGTFSGIYCIDLLRPVLLRLKELRSFKFLIIGNFEYSFPEVDLEVVQWSKASEIEDLQRIDIGVYPLPINDWVLGKSGLKALQYMAMGVPAIASDVGSAPLIIQHMQNGCLVKSVDDWVDVLVRLIDDPGLRRRLGQAGRTTVEERYSTQVIGAQYLQVLDRVARL